MPRALGHALPLSLLILACSRQPVDGGMGPTIQPHAFSSSLACRECHTDIFTYWQASAHADGYRNRAFQYALKTYRDQISAKDLEDCLACHAPLAKGEVKPPADEGVNCDFCHSVKAVRNDGGRWRFEVEPGLVKRGPIDGLPPDRHHMVYSDLFKKSEFCAGCHEYVSAAGLPILTTYSEWKASPAAKAGQTCQTCHMPAGTGNIVDAKARRTSASVSTHRMDRSHEPAQLRADFDLRIEILERDGTKARAVIAIEHLSGGHHVPTGMPTHLLVLDVEVATSAGRHIAERHKYHKRLVNARGLTVTTDVGAFVEAVAVAEDTRLRAGETRRENVVFDLRADEAAVVRASLSYAHASEPLALPMKVVGVAEATRELR